MSEITYTQNINIQTTGQKAIVNITSKSKLVVGKQLLTIYQI